MLRKCKKNCAIQPQSNRKRTTATENQTPRQKSRRYLCGRSKDQTAAPAIRTFESYLYGLQVLMD